MVAYSPRARALVRGALSGAERLPLDNQRIVAAYRRIDAGALGKQETPSVWEFLRVTQKLRRGEVCRDTPLPRVITALEMLWALTGLERTGTN